jgi:hypothetical protein
MERRSSRLRSTSRSTAASSRGVNSCLILVANGTHLRFRGWCVVFHPLTLFARTP